MDHLVVVDVPDLLCFSHVDRLKKGCSDSEFNIQNDCKGRKIRRAEGFRHRKGSVLISCKKSRCFACQQLLHFGGHGWSDFSCPVFIG